MIAQEEGPPSATSTGFQLQVTSCASNNHVTPMLKAVDFCVAMVRFSTIQLLPLLSFVASLHCLSSCVHSLL